MSNSPTLKGVYILLASLDRDARLKIGALGYIPFKKGIYAYSGSAMGGLEQRIRRHLCRKKKLHWHIDYLLGNAEVKNVLVRETNRKSEECRAAEKLEQYGGIPVVGFGSSDCKCKSHLFHFITQSMINFENYRLLKR